MRGFSLEISYLNDIIKASVCSIYNPGLHFRKMIRVLQEVF